MSKRSEQLDRIENLLKEAVRFIYEQRPKIKNIVSDEAIKEINKAAKKLENIQRRADQYFSKKQSESTHKTPFYALAECFDATINVMKLADEIKKIHEERDLTELCITTPFSIHECRYVHEYTKDIKATKKILEDACSLGVSTEILIGIIDSYNKLKNK